MCLKEFSNTFTWNYWQSTVRVTPIFPVYKPRSRVAFKPQVYFDTKGWSYISFTRMGKVGMRKEQTRNPKKFSSFFWSWQPCQTALNNIPLFSWLFEGYEFFEASWNSPEVPWNKFCGTLWKRNVIASHSKDLLLFWCSSDCMIYTLKLNTIILFNSKKKLVYLLFKKSCFSSIHLF